MDNKSAGIDGKVPLQKLRISVHEYKRPSNSQRRYRQRISFTVLVLVILLALVNGGLISYSQNDTISNHGLVNSHDLDELSNGIIGTGDPLETVTFPIGSFVIPMDDKQLDVLKAFGFTHALLRNGTCIYRIIEPPDIIIETVLYPSSEFFSGGPILVMPLDAGIVNTVRLQFPTVSLDTTVSQLVSDQVDRIVEPTDILVIYGIWGHTQDVLTDMEIPFTMVNTSVVNEDPDMLFDYDLIVDDCPGWWGSVPSNITSGMRTFAKRGGEIIFTDIALADMDKVFPGYLSVVPNAGGTWPCSIYKIPEFPAQYYGPSTLDIFTMSAGRVMGNVIDPSVRVMVDSNNYSGQYRILAAYFYYGGSVDWPGGIVEGFGYHPGDQPPGARVLASLLYGNKFVHLPPEPDLEVSPSDIKFNPVSPVEVGTPVTVNATIHNIGSRNASDVLVRFYDGAPALGIQIGSDQTIPLIERKGGIGHAEVSWIATDVKTHDIYVTVDPENAIMESDETNNIAYNLIEVIDVLPPLLYINAVGDDIVLNWTQPQLTGLSYYLLYRAPSQTEFDFLDIWMNTSIDINPLTGMIDPLNPVWIDTNVTKIGDPNYLDEYYYIVRAVNALGIRSRTSNTVGYCVLQFGTGMNTFSLPLELFTTRTLDYYVNNIPSATSISWLDDNDDWWTYPSNPITPQAKIGEGYVLNLTAPSDFVFIGQPASMILYKDGFGFESLTRDDISASVDSSGDITVSWIPILGAQYFIYWGIERNGFHTGAYTILNGGLPVAGPPFVHVGAASSPGENYYMVVPFDPVLGLNGSSTYSIGVFTAEYNGNEMLGLPLKPVWGDKSADWFVEQVPNSLGLVHLEGPLWKAHFKEFPEGVYDTIIEYGRGYKISVYATSIYSFVGW